MSGTHGQTLSGAEARRIAIAAQGLAAPRPAGRVDARHLRRVVDRIKQLQLDAVNVLERAHYLPLFSRLGPYRRELIDELTHRRRELFEGWGHERSLHPVERWPLLRATRMDPTSQHPRWTEFWGRNSELIDKVYAEVAERGPLRVADLTDPGDRRGPWWGWNHGKSTLEWLFRIGRVAVAGRRNFEQVYDITERVIPPEALEAPVPGATDAVRELTGLAAESLGIGTARDIADYYRVAVRTTSVAVDELVAAGRLVPVRVEGWRQPAYLHAEAALPRTVDATALLVPFDPLVWERSRTERLFGFHYRIEIYTPKPKRTFGYYVLPFLMGDRLVARVDLKADRKASALLVPGAFVEDGADRGEVAARLTSELRSMADWLELEEVRVQRKGNLSSSLRGALRAR